MRIKLVIFFLIFLFNSPNNVFSNINDKIIAKIGNKIITNYDIINEVNTILKHFGIEAARSALLKEFSQVFLEFNLNSSSP